MVPPGHYFAMGDHRGVSLDSRYWGFIPQENVIGRPMFIYWSFDTPADQYTKTGMADRLGFWRMWCCTSSMKRGGGER